MTNNYLESAIKQFQYYKSLGDKAMQQLTDEQLFWQYNAESNSIAIIVKHISGNMISRWTDFLTADGEKPTRNRDGEFENEFSTRDEVLACWEAGWSCLFSALAPLNDDDLEKLIYIRNQGHSVMEAINRQLAHYPYHIGQMVYVAKMLTTEWVSLSIPRNQSAGYNAEKFAKEKSRTHFTDEFLKKKDT